MLKMLVAGLILAGSLVGSHAVQTAASDPFDPMMVQPVQVAASDPFDPMMVQPVQVAAADPFDPMANDPIEPLA